ncbi:8-oxo-dGTP diphosphatase MutT [Ferrimonas gelatinilytica]|uniref:8-oxo-dGTP diphosphatase n=1 Tax=Ferrimonas gelatinilytica TaxID=1255257 RepID=A0ABP9SFB4_9GAMM
MKAIQVAIGVAVNGNAEVLVALRAPEQHQGGLWEFPGGKVEPGEDVESALAREFLEEVGLRVLQSELLYEISHDYGDRRVALTVFLITSFEGEPRPKEGNPIEWVTLEQLKALAMPAANRPIVEAVLERLGLERVVE